MNADRTTRRRRTAARALQALVVFTLVIAAGILLGQRIAPLVWAREPADSSP